MKLRDIYDMVNHWERFTAFPSMYEKDDIAEAKKLLKENNGALIEDWEQQFLDDTIKAMDAAIAD